MLGDKLTLSNSYTERGYISSAAITVISLAKSSSVSLLYEELFYSVEEQNNRF